MRLFHSGILILALSNAYGQTTNHVEAIPYQHYRALRIRQRNQSSELPSPDYWGIGGLEWETKTSELPKAALGPARDFRFFGLPCRRELKFESESKGLSKVSHYYASGTTDRAERLKQFCALKAELMKIYSAPTHNLKPERLMRGADGYVQGVDKDYCLEWRGGETIVSLRLSDQELVLEFRQSPTSRAIEMKQNAGAGSNFVSRMTGNVTPMTLPGSSPTPK
jgi:hypothetical protein